MLLHLRRLVVTTLLAGPALALGSSPSATAAGETCDGLAATMVGTPGGRVLGTPSDDVIVSNGAEYVDGADGDDVICTTGSVPRKHSGIQVSGGRGDNVIDRRGDLDPGVSALVALSGDSEVFYGAPGPDQVSLEKTAPYAGPVTVQTGDGEDTVFVDRITRFGAPATVDTGPGDDSVSVSDTVANLSVSGGDGTDTLTSGDTAPTTISVDAATGAATYGSGGMLPFAGFEAYIFELANLRSSVTFRGTEAQETVVVDGRGQLTSARMRGGDDVVRYQKFTKPRTHLDGGRGQDRLEVLADHESDVVVDLAQHWFSARAHHRSPLRHVEDVTAMGGTVSVRGDSHDNRVLWWGCQGGVVSSAGGDDVVGPAPAPRVCPKVAFTVSGGAGSDRLQGSRGRDVLDGGPGRDRCLMGEVLTGCERRS